MHEITIIFTFTASPLHSSSHEEEGHARKKITQGRRSRNFYFLFIDDNTQNLHMRIVTPLPLQSHKTNRFHYSKNKTIVG